MHFQHISNEIESIFNYDVQRPIKFWFQLFQYQMKKNEEESNFGDYTENQHSTD